MRPSPFQAFVRVMFGCDKFCTYCVVPSVRGPEQSRSPRDIAAEVDVLAKQGVKEITLLGQTVNSYRHTQDGRQFRLSDILAMLHDTAGIERIKFVTNFPRHMGDDLLQAVRDLRKVSPYLHVPAQSGCSDVLKRMKRGYTAQEYRELVARIYETVPGAAISSDFIVGFCGETEASFQKSMDLIRECRFKNSYIFKYSPRPGTKAMERFEDDVPESVKRRRNNEMLALQSQISEEDNAQFIGRTVEVLVEGPSKTALKQQSGQDAGAQDSADGSANDSADASLTQLVGRTECDRIVVFDGEPRQAGGFLDVQIHDCTPTTLIGMARARENRPQSDALLPVLQ